MCHHISFIWAYACLICICILSNDLYHVYQQSLKILGNIIAIAIMQYCCKNITPRMVKTGKKESEPESLVEKYWAMALAESQAEHS